MCLDNAGQGTRVPRNHGGAEINFGDRNNLVLCQDAQHNYKKKYQPQYNKTPKKEMYHRDKRDMGIFVGVKIAFFHFKGVTSGRL